MRQTIASPLPPDRKVLARQAPLLDAGAAEEAQAARDARANPRAWSSPRVGPVVPGGLPGLFRAGVSGVPRVKVVAA
jgi:hypothetical protein